MKDCRGGILYDGCTKGIDFVGTYAVCMRKVKNSGFNHALCLEACYVTAFCFTNSPGYV